MTAQPNSSTLRPAQIGFDPENPFANDLFLRRPVADRLTGLVERMTEGGVIALDAPWGEGKTWFGRNWVADLASRGFPTVMIDAFGQDYTDDPFMMVCSEILPAISDDSARQKVEAAGRKLAGALVPAAAKALLNLGGRVLLGSSEITEDFKKLAEEMEQAGAKALEVSLSKRLSDHADGRRNVEGFANALREYASGLEKPMVVVIDELDRCRPDFAVRAVERVKHFFDVPKVVFVLLLNRSQIEAGVRGLYGQDVDAASYLGKFVHFWLKLPKAVCSSRHGNDHNLLYCRNLSQRYGLSGQNQEAFGTVLASLASADGFSLRDLEQAYALFALSQPTNSASALIAWTVFIKVSRSNLFTRLLAGETAAHVEALALAQEISGRTDRNWTLEIMEDMHKGHADGFKEPLKEQTRQALSSIGRWSLDQEQLVPWLCQKIDLSVE